MLGGTFINVKEGWPSGLRRHLFTESNCHRFESWLSYWTFFFFFKFCPNFKGLYLVSAKFRDTGIFFVKSTVSELPLHIGLIRVFLHILAQN